MPTKKDLVDLSTDFVESSELENIFEETMDDLKNRSWSSVRKRVKSQGLRSVYLGMTKDGVIRYKTTSGTTPGKWWHQEIYLADLPTIVQMMTEDKRITAREGVLLALKGNVLVYCDDKSFLYYGWKYMAHKGKYGLKKENRYPKKRNPALTGAVCKHLLSVFATIPFDWNKIVRDARAQGIIPKYKRLARKKVK